MSRNSKWAAWQQLTVKKNIEEETSTIIIEAPVTATTIDIEMLVSEEPVIVEETTLIEEEVTKPTTKKAKKVNE